MECKLPDLTDEQNLRIGEILQETKLLETEELSPEICKIEHSKKNLVLSITPSGQNPVVLKLFSSEKSLKNEMKIYTQLGKSDFFTSKIPTYVIYSIPKLLKTGQDYIITEFIDGINGMELITQQIQSPWNPALWKQVIGDLIQWVIEFSEITKVVPLDCHIRNFILRESTVYGVDFEELEDRNEESLLKLFSTLYFSILGAYPGVIEGLELTKKADIGILLLRRLLLSPLFQNKSIREMVPAFIEHTQNEAAAVIQRRINFERGRGYDTKKIKENLDAVFARIQSDFD